MNLRELMIERILFSVSDEELRNEFHLSDDDILELSDMDLFELHENVMGYCV